MAGHHATIDWVLDGDFLARRYSRAHSLTFDGGLTVPGSSSPSVVPLPWSREDAIDPEAAFTAALSSCHMLWFLDLASRAGFVVTSYRDEAVGTLGKDSDGKWAMTRVMLRPKVVFAGDRTPSLAALEELHHRAHQECFIANSVKTEVAVEPQAA
jgi:organic hydroperoxide reductase OsmC/OhrA